MGVTQSMKFTEVANIRIDALVYSLYVRQKPDARPQVFSLDYGDRLRVYDVQGSMRSARSWSSKVRCIAVADVLGRDEEVVVGGVGRRILVVDQRGTPVWNVELESNVIACDARDIDGDGAAEVVVALENQRVVLWNDDKTALFSRTMDDPIADVWLEDMTTNGELEVFVADRRGRLTILTGSGYKLKTLQLGETITVFAILGFGERKLFVTGNHSNELKIWDLNGLCVGSISLSAPPKAMAAGSAGNMPDISYLVVSTTDRRVSFWHIKDSERPTRAETIVLQEIQSTREILYRRAIKCGNCGAPASPESPTCASCGVQLEMLEEYVIDTLLQESIDSITSKYTRIELRELDRILRKTLSRPITYNLHNVLQKMIKKNIINGHIERHMFVRSLPVRAGREAQGLDPAAIQRVRKVLVDLLRKKNSIEIALLEQQTGVPREILRRTIIILLGDGELLGTLSGDVFEIDKQQNREALVKALEQGLMAVTTR